jgi:Xaa-Pro aminopeptidase
MARYSEDYTRADAAADAYADARDEAIKDCKKDEGFAWRWRIVESASAKIQNLRLSKDPADLKKAKDLARRIKHLQKWCDEYIEEEMDAAAAAAEARNPMGYRGLSWSMFI